MVANYRLLAYEIGSQLQREAFEFGRHWEQTREMPTSDPLRKHHNAIMRNRQQALQRKVDIGVIPVGVAREWMYSGITAQKEYTEWKRRYTSLLKNVV